MKYKIIYLITVALMFMGATAAQQVEVTPNRYHQHLEAQPKAACTGHSEDTFCTHLPLLSITTDAELPAPHLTDETGAVLYDALGYALVNNEMVGASVALFDHENKNNHLTDTPECAERALIRIRGRSSRSFDKPSYLVKFKEQDLTTNKDVSLCGMTADSNWVLHGPFLDKSLIRNYLCYNLAGKMMEYAPNVRFCELFLNGEYQGIYLITEKIDYNKNGRIHITKSDPDLDTTSYIVQVDQASADPRYALNTFGSYSMLTSQLNTISGHLSVVYPSTTLTPEQRSYIERDLSEFEKSLFSFDYNDPKQGYQRYIDVDSFVDFYLLNEFTLNYDAPLLSTYLYKDIGSKLKLCVWDFNSAFDYYQYTHMDPQNFVLHSQMWYSYLFKDPHFVDEVVARYWQLRDRVFSEEYLTEYIDQTIAYLGDAVQRNYEVWGYSFQSEYNGANYDFLTPADRNVRTYDQAIQQMKDCIYDRLDYMDEHIGTLYRVCHTSVNKKFNYIPEVAAR